MNVQLHMYVEVYVLIDLSSEKVCVHIYSAQCVKIDYLVPVTVPLNHGVKNASLQLAEECLCLLLCLQRNITLLVSSNKLTLQYLDLFLQSGFIVEHFL